MSASCDVCGQPMEPQKGRGGRRKRHADCTRRKVSGKGKAAPAAALSVGSAREAVAAEIAALNAQSGAEAFAALSIAARIDAGDEPGAAHAALVKELRAVLADLRRSAAPAAGLFDQLAAKRAENERAAHRA